MNCTPSAQVVATRHMGRLTAMNDAARRLKNIMVQQGRSVYWLAQALNHDHTNMKKTLDGKRRMTVEFVARACKALGARPEYVAFEHGNVYEDEDPLKLAHPLDLALAYDRGRFAPDVIASVRAYRDAHPDEQCSPRQWTTMLKTRQAQLFDDQEDED